MNPSYARENPRQKKALTFDQAERRQAKAVRFLRNVTHVPDLADEIENLSVRQYAERKGLQLNPSRKTTKEKKVKSQDLDAIKGAISEGFQQVAQKLRANPRKNQATAVPSNSSAAPGDGANDKTKKIMATIDNALTLLDDGDSDEAYNLLCDVLEDDQD